MSKDPHDKANLEMTLDDHRALGGTPPKELVQNPGKTVAETMDDATLLDFVRKEVETVAEVFEMAKKGGERERDLLHTTRDSFLAPNIVYLREIGRLPAEFAGLDPVVKFALGDEATVNVLHHPAGISAGCAKCRTIIAKGQFAVGVKIGEYRYVAGNNPPKTCCGEEKKVPLLFDNEPLAALAAQGVVETLKKDGNTSNLRLLQLAQFVSTAAH